MDDIIERLMGWIDGPEGPCKNFGRTDYYEALQKDLRDAVAELTRLRAIPYRTTIYPVGYYEALTGEDRVLESDAP